jgi:hypothetical protein
MFEVEMSQHDGRLEAIVMPIGRRWRQAFPGHEGLPWARRVHGLCEAYFGFNDSRLVFLVQSDPRPLPGLIKLLMNRSSCSTMLFWSLVCSSLQSLALKLWSSRTQMRLEWRVLAMVIALVAAACSDRFTLRKKGLEEGHLALR